MKAFLYLYPIKPYFSSFNITKDDMDTLNRAIECRYKNQGYDVFISLFPDEDNFAINNSLVDGVFMSNISFRDFTNTQNKEYIDQIPFPNIEELLEPLKRYDQVVVSGFHYNSCVKGTANYLRKMGIDASVDLDLTECFFDVNKSPLFNIDCYDKNIFRKIIVDSLKKSGYTQDKAEHLFSSKMNDPIFGYELLIPDESDEIQNFLKRCSEDNIRVFTETRFKRLHISVQNCDIYNRLLTLISKRLMYQEQHLLLIIYEVLLEFNINNSPEIIDNFFKLLGFHSEVVKCFYNGKLELVNIYYPNGYPNSPLVIYNSNHNTKFINYDGEVIKGPHFVCLSTEASLEFFGHKDIICDMSKSEKMLRLLKNINSSFELENGKVSYSYYGEK